MPGRRCTPHITSDPPSHHLLPQRHHRQLLAVLGKIIERSLGRRAAAAHQLPRLILVAEADIKGASLQQGGDDGAEAAGQARHAAMHY